MTTDVTTCDATQDALITGAIEDAHQRHLATCPACQGLSAMTRSIKTELEPVPTSPGQRPHIVSAPALHALFLNL